MQKTRVSFFSPLALDNLKRVFSFPCLLSQILVLKDIFWKVMSEIMIQFIILTVMVAV